MKNEDTIYDENIRNDKTRLDDMDDNRDINEENAQSPEEDTAENEEGRKGSGWKTAAMGAGMGVLIGGVSAFAINKAMGATTESSEDPGNSGNAPADGSSGNVDVDAIVDDQMNVASGVNDDMSFAEAFETAREEIGSNGAFVWRGNVYSTFTAEEWNSMTPEEREEYNSHFNWAAASGGGNDAGTDGNPSDDSPQDTNNVSVEDNVPADVIDDNDDDANVGGAGELEVSEVPDGQVDIEGGQTAPYDGIDDIPAETVPGDEAGEDELGASILEDSGDDIQVIETTPDVEVLGVVYDEQTGGSLAEMMVGDEQVIMLDANNDGVFEGMGTDLNGDGQITQDEISDISDQGIGVDNFESNSFGPDSLYASADDLDYINDMPDGSEMA